MKKRYLGGTVVLGAILLVSACGGGGGGSPGSSDLTGTWKGVYDIGAFYEMDVVVSGTSITSVSLGGTSTGDSGSFALVQSKIYEYSLTPSGGYGGFMSDSSGTHAALLDLATPGFAVLQKGATAITNITSGDELAGSWAGYSVHLDAMENVDNVSSTSVTVSPYDGISMMPLSGTGPSGAFTGGLTGANSAGVYWGSYTITGSGITGTVWVYLSPDYNFAASWACDNGAVPPSVDCSYHAWNRQ